MKDKLTFFGLVVTYLFRICSSFEIDMTVLVPAGRRECFYQSIKAKQTLDFEFQVIEGGDLDINFIIRSPSNKALATEARKAEGIYTRTTQESGDYLFCFDNTFSRVSSKTVFFDLALDYDDDEAALVHPKTQWFEAGAEVLEVRIEDMQTSLDIVQDNIKKAQQHQRVWRNVEFRDRYVAERNYERVSFWSFVSTIVMVLTFFIQVVMIRYLFSDNRKITMKT
ncbi:transmembrane emp24 domain-containing protein 5-like [Anneissia japonica]|uniref:transmembrane emp24 domain-containing protein 5-like n=1 Tax=Anneissia japonica TaxID=1529436 RepID=UPI0014258D0E|nr:transmembrane emp24 domain-containing protein 5-like [Anneissia japonica]